MKISNILISQPAPQNSSPYTELQSKYKVNIDFMPFFKVEPLSAKEFRAQKINILDFTAIVFTAKTTTPISAEDIRGFTTKSLRVMPGFVTFIT